MELLVDHDRRRKVGVLHARPHEAAAAEDDFATARMRPREHAARLTERTPVAVHDDELREEPVGGDAALLEAARERTACEIPELRQEAHARIAAQPRRRVGEGGTEHILERGAPAAREAHGRRRSVFAGRLERSGEIQETGGENSRPHKTRDARGRAGSRRRPRRRLAPSLSAPREGTLGLRAAQERVRAPRRERRRSRRMLR